MSAPSHAFLVQQAVLTACTDEWLLRSSARWKDYIRGVMVAGPSTPLCDRIRMEFRKLARQYHTDASA